ncbi:unnamed protein product [Urochloa humidicola]
MLLFGGGGSANSNGFFRGIPMAVLGMDDAARVGKRPFFTTHEELLEEEYYDEQAPEKKRRLTAEQVRLLERSFEEENKLEPERKTELARRLGMAPRQVAVWFQNRRARWKTKQLETDYDRLKAAYDALAADHQGLLADNDSLRAQAFTPIYYRPAGLVWVHPLHSQLRVWFLLQPKFFQRWDKQGTGSRRLQLQLYLQLQACHC